VMLFREDHRHPGVDLSHKLVRFSGDDRAGVQPIAVRGIFPTLPQTSEHEWRIVLHADRVRNFFAKSFFPLVKAIPGNQAAPFFERLPVRRCRVNGLDPRIDRLEGDFGIFGPIRNQAPPQSVQAALLSCWIEPNREHILSRSDVPTDRQISLWRYRNVIPASKFFLRRGPSVSSAHASILHQIFYSVETFNLLSEEPKDADNPS